MKSLASTGPAYLGVAVACVISNNIFLISLDAMGVYYVVNVILSAMVMIPLSYALHLHFTYELSHQTQGFWRYAMVQIVNTPIAVLLFFLIHDQLGLAMLWAAPAVTILMFIYNFVSSYWAVALGRTPRSSNN